MIVVLVVVLVLFLAEAVAVWRGLAVVLPPLAEDVEASSEPDAP